MDVVSQYQRLLWKNFWEHCHWGKQTAIEETSDLDTYRLEELVSNLKTFELYIGKAEKKVKNMAFSSIKRKEQEVVHDDNEPTYIALLTKEFTEIL